MVEGGGSRRRWMSQLATMNRCLISDIFLDSILVRNILRMWPRCPCQLLGAGLARRLPGLPGIIR